MILFFFKKKLFLNYSNSGNDFLDEHRILLQTYINGQNLTEFLLINIESLLNYRQNGIDLKLLWTILCFHQETFLLIFLFSFLMQIIFKHLKLFISARNNGKQSKELEICPNKNSSSKSQLFSLYQCSSIENQASSVDAKSMQLSLKKNNPKLSIDETSSIYYLLKKASAFKYFKFEINFWKPTKFRFWQH